jgi:hypothetical protein
MMFRCSCGPKSVSQVVTVEDNCPDDVFEDDCPEYSAKHSLAYFPVSLIASKVLISECRCKMGTFSSCSRYSPSQIHRGFISDSTLSDSAKRSSEDANILGLKLYQHYTSIALTQ